MINHQIAKILIIGPAWVGDMVMAQSLFKLLKQRNPHVVIDVLAPEWSVALLTRMPEVNQALISPFKHGELQLAKRYALARRLRDRQYNQAIVLPNSFKSALIPWWAKIPLRTGWRRELRGVLLNDARTLDKKRLPLMIERFCALGLPAQEKSPLQLPWPELKTSVAETAVALQKYALKKTDQPILALCPGAEFGPSKCWPAKYYAAVAKYYLQEGWQVWIFGSPRDQSIANEIQAATQSACMDLTGKTSLADAIDLLALADTVLSNDSGLMHIAAALQRPLVAVYGSTSTVFTPPLTQRVNILNLQLPCSPCFKRECPLGHFKCMLDLYPERVITAVADMRHL